MKRIGKIICICLCGLTGWIPAYAQQQDSGRHNWCTRAEIETRIDYDFVHYDVDGSNRSAFQGKYLNFRLDGELTSMLSYHWRQRINAGNMGFSTTFFEGTDWAYLDWQFAPHFSISAGKEIVAIGGWEYDLAPIQMYYWSTFWNNVNCYEIGASLHYTDKHNHVQLQVSNSPYITKNLENLFAYNLIWYGDFKWFKPIYSTNLIEYTHGSYIHYLNLGNKFDFGKAYLYIDLMHRATDRQSRYFFMDYSIVAEAKAYLGKRWTVFSKGGYDENCTENPVGTIIADTYVAPGTQYRYIGIGGEFSPLLGRNAVRLHAFVALKDDMATHSKMLEADAGLYWRIGIK